MTTRHVQHDPFRAVGHTLQFLGLSAVPMFIGNTKEVDTSMYLKLLPVICLKRIPVHLSSKTF